MFKKHERYQEDGAQSIYRVEKGLPGLPTAARAFNKKLTKSPNNIGLYKCPSSRATFRMAGTNAHEG